MVIQSPLSAQARRLRARLAVVSAVALLLAGCAAPSYYVQAAAGQWQLARQSRSIDDWLADETTDPEIAARLVLAQELRAFAVRELALPPGDSYSSYAATGREAATWIVVAAPEFSLEPRTWCFLVAGCVPYRGYFERGDADRFAAKLRDKGYDVSVSPAAAYSTLGWFDDPLVDSMFGNDETDFAGILFHEMAHQELYLPGDTLFSESYAAFVEETGVRLWLEERGQHAAFDTWLERRAARRRIDALLSDSRQQLADLYGKGGPSAEMRLKKSEILERLCADLDAAATSGRGAEAGRKDASCAINNATLALHRSYRGGHCAFARLYEETGRDMQAFHQRARAVSNGSAAERAAWLERPCDPVAPGGEL